MGALASRQLGPERRRPGRAAGSGPAHTCQPDFDIAANATTFASLLARADAGTRERLVHRLQERSGNVAVQRLVGVVDAGLPVQRWAVGLARGTTDCATVVSYLDVNSPYKATSGWARTRASFVWGGSPSYTESGGVITASVTSPTVTPTVSVDMPTWSPTNATMASAWSGMTANLRAHEARHEAIAATWLTTLRTRLAALSVTVPNRTLAAFNRAVQAEWDGWIAEHQAAQNAIDPYTAILDCSGGEGEESETVGVGEESAFGGEP